jgi:hypothetical protein
MERREEGEGTASADYRRFGFAHLLMSEKMECLRRGRGSLAA